MSNEKLERQNWDSTLKKTAIATIGIGTLAYLTFNYWENKNDSTTLEESPLHHCISSLYEKLGGTDNINNFVQNLAEQISLFKNIYPTAKCFFFGEESYELEVMNSVFAQSQDGCYYPSYYDIGQMSDALSSSKPNVILAGLKYGWAHFQMLISMGFGSQDLGFEFTPDKLLGAITDVEYCLSDSE